MSSIFNIFLSQTWVNLTKTSTLICILQLVSVNALFTFYTWSYISSYSLCLEKVGGMRVKQANHSPLPTAELVILTMEQCIQYTYFTL